MRQRPRPAQGRTDPNQKSAARRERPMNDSTLPATQDALGQIDALPVTRQVLQEVLGLPEPPAPDARLRLDLAMSSYAMMETAVLLEGRLHSPADFGKIAQAQTVEELARAW